MHRMRKAAIAALFTGLMSMPAPAQQINDARDLLKKVRQTYSSLKSFQFDGVTVAELEGTDMQTKMDTHFEGAFIAPAKMHIETKNPVMGVLFVSDGHTGWVYIPSTKTYSKLDIASFSKPTSPSVNEEGHKAFSGYSAAAGLGFDMFQLGIADRVKQAVVLREEGVEVEGKEAECYVVRAEYEQSKEEAKVLPTIKTYWIDKDRFIVLRENSESHVERESDFVHGSFNMKSSTTLTKVRLNEPVPDQLFVFTPPAGAMEGKSPVGGPDAR